MSVQSCGVTPAIESLVDSTPITDSAASSEMPVATSGRSAASSDPKTISKTIIAAPTPTSVLDCDDGLVDAATGPRTSTCSDELPAERAVSTKCVASVALTLLESTEKSTVAKATLPSALICPAPFGPYGEVSFDTLGKVPTLLSMVSICVCTAGSFTEPWCVAKTMCSVSPATLGAALASRAAAWPLS